MNTRQQSILNAVRAMRMAKRGAAVLTPEAEQAAVQAPEPQQQQPMPQQAPQQQQQMPQQGGQVPPEVLQDQGFLQWAQQQGVQVDPNSGTFYGPDGQPMAPDMVMQGYQMYMQQMQGGQQAQAAPQQQPMPQQQQPMPQQGGQLPPEILQDQQFIAFMQEAMGVPFDPNSGSFIDPQSGQPLAPDMVMQAYQAYMQQMQQMQQGAQPMDAAGAAAAGASVPPEILSQFQSAIDASLEAFTQQLDKKMETLLDKLETVKMTIESMRDTDDKRTADDKAELQSLQAELAEDLNPYGMGDEPVKTASVHVIQTAVPLTPQNMFSFLMSNGVN